MSCAERFDCLNIAILNSRAIGRVICKEEVDSSNIALRQRDYAVPIKVKFVRMLARDYETQDFSSKFWETNSSNHLVGREIVVVWLRLIK